MIGRKDIAAVSGRTHTGAAELGCAGAVSSGAEW